MELDPRDFIQKLTPLHRDQWRSLGFPIVFHVLPKDGDVVRGNFCFRQAPKEAGHIFLHGYNSFVLSHELGHAAFELARHHGLDRSDIYFEEFVLSLQTHLAVAALQLNLSNHG